MDVMARCRARVGARRDSPANATRTTVGTMGVLAAWAGVEHGVGEVRQGWLAPPSWVFRSWEGAPAFEPVNGEPAMTVVPNLLVTGVLAVIVALAVGVWAVRFADERHGGAVLIALSVVLLLVGGGFGPPLIGVLAGVLATRIGSTTSAPRQPASRALAGFWPWPLIAAAAFFLGLVPGTALLYLAVGTDEPALVLALTGAAFASAALAGASARALDRVEQPAQRRPVG
jgi:hypothetical protein